MCYCVRAASGASLARSRAWRRATHRTENRCPTRVSAVATPRWADTERPRCAGIAPGPFRLCPGAQCPLGRNARFWVRPDQKSVSGRTSVAFSR